MEIIGYFWGESVKNAIKKASLRHEKPSYSKLLIKSAKRFGIKDWMWDCSAPVT